VERADKWLKRGILIVREVNKTIFPLQHFVYRKSL